jgi:hypothetical protein
MNSFQGWYAAVLAALLAAGCVLTPEPPRPPVGRDYAAQHLSDYVPVKLTSDLSKLSDRTRKMTALLIEASIAIDPIYWQQSWGDRAALLALTPDAETRRLAEINYGAWDRLNGDYAFVNGVSARPPGAQFYPADMNKAEFDASELPGKTSEYTLLRRGGDNKLATLPYHEAYKDDLQKAAALLQAAALLSEDKTFRSYLELRAKALLTDDYRPSDMAWMDMKTNPVDIVIGPIETYEDQLYGYKAAYEGLVLVKDAAWSAKLARFAKFLPELQRGLPVEAKYKAEKPGGAADLNAYDAVYYSGNANTGAKTIAINLPNDEEVQLKKGTRRLQLENVIRAKFDKILMPIARELIAADQLANLSFDAFFEDTMFHEVAHGLGVKETINGKGLARKALQEYAGGFEEGKADILGIWLIKKLTEKGEMDKAKLMDCYVTSLASLLRSVRFGASDSHGKANMVRFNFFLQQAAFVRDPATGRYRVDRDRFEKAMELLTARLLMVQGDGDYAMAKQMTDTLGVIRPELATDLKRLQAARVPVDIVFEQGLDVLGLTRP